MEAAGAGACSAGLKGAWGRGGASGGGAGYVLPLRDGPGYPGRLLQVGEACVPHHLSAPGSRPPLPMELCPFPAHVETFLCF